MISMQPATRGDELPRVTFSFKSAGLSRLHDYWSEKAGDRPMPSRRDLDPVIDIPQLTRHLWLVDVEHEPLRFRFRLLGTEVVNRYGWDFTGQRLDEVDFGDYGDAIRREYEETVRSKAPIYARHHHYIEETNVFLPYERLLLPLSDDGQLVNMLLGGGYPIVYEAG